MERRFLGRLHHSGAGAHDGGVRVCLHDAWRPLGVCCPWGASCLRCPHVLFWLDRKVIAILTAMPERLRGKGATTLSVAALVVCDSRVVRRQAVYRVYSVCVRPTRCVCITRCVMPNKECVVPYCGSVPLILVVGALYTRRVQYGTRRV